MGIFDYGTQREALHKTAEVYKRYAKQFLKIKGFLIDSDSSYDGKFPDLVVREISTQDRYLVEIKNTKISPVEKGFADELIRYFIEILKSESYREELQYKGLMIITKTTVRGKWEELISNDNETAVQDWMDEMEEKPDFMKEEYRPLFSLSSIVVAELFQQIELHRLDIDKMSELIKEWNKTPNDSFDVQFSRLFDKIEEMKFPKNNRVQHSLNVFKFEIKQPIYHFNTSFKNIKDVWKLDDPIPPFLWLQNKSIISISHTEFSDFIDGEIAEYDLERLISRNEQEAIKFCNLMLKDILYALYIKRTNFKEQRYAFNKYFEEPYDDDMELRVRSYSEKPGNNPIFKKVISCYSKGNGFFYHLSAVMFVTLLWGEPHLTIIPSKSFSDDGRKFKFGRSHRSLEQSFRKSITGYNDTFRNEVGFFYRYISNKIDEIDIEWVKNIKISRIELQYPYDSTPRDVRQRPLEAFFG